MEQVDIYDENRNKTGITKYRGIDKIENGEFVLAVEALIINSNREILISKRSKYKPKYPGMWEINGGANRTGETSLDSIVREINEELGIVLDSKEGILLKTVKNEYRFKDVWIFKKDIDIKDLKFTDNEVEKAKWVTYKEFEKYKADKILIDTSNISKEDYETALEYLNLKINYKE